MANPRKIDFRDELTSFFDSLFSIPVKSQQEKSQKIYYRSNMVQAQGILYARPNRRLSADEKISTPKQIKQRLDNIKDLKLDQTYINFPIFYSEQGQVSLETPHKDLETVLTRTDNARGIRETVIKFQFLQLALQLIEAVYELHKKKLVHRDISLNNVLFYETANGRFYLKLADLDETSDPSDLNDVVRPLYKNGYNPPENITNPFEIDAFKLGRTLENFLNNTFVGAKIPDSVDAKGIEVIQNISKRLTANSLSVEGALNTLKEYLAPLDQVKIATVEDKRTILAFYEATQSFENASNSSSDDKNIVANAAHELHMQAAGILSEAYQEKSLNHALIDSVKSIEKKVKVNSGNIKDNKDRCVEIVKEALAKYAAQLKAEQTGTGLCSFFNKSRRTGIYSAIDLLKDVEKQTDSSKQMTIIKTHLTKGSGKIFKGILSNILLEETNVPKLDFPAVRSVCPS